MIRKLKNVDIEKIMDIWLVSTIKAHDFISKEYWQNNYNIVKNEYIPISETFVYEKDGEIKGFISIINNEFIGALFVDIRFQGMGIGTKLINYSVEKYEKLILAVYKENKNSVEFYTRKGFKIIEEGLNEDSGYLEYIMGNKI
ncbi:acetyltransferase family protein [[Clostridium] bifermentans ATCC 638]|uniref:Acetyltransferase family protein n=1 Tax=Paraclostridium bifermentans ATCC 638 = DSM 14991 TaxID=1233171 RepID=T4VR55_PARBF|nr:N-acetyltransferase [Paraclostridium bifermentans]EQK43157.1 acetyltransferase family protein [[Clostridium] bifermentans ATCC 638] [Paraclostridium bifermentans ATCC 638 = DSM 14991]RIZ60384.1 N-acetyltransferase [Paraclostridium bifermentans]UAG17026.1 N-acetyltransferase [Paraclostridium bifermentans]